MKAALIHQFGNADVFQFEEIPTPVVKPNEVLVKLAYAGLNHVDVWVRKGLPAYPVMLPHVMGADGAGTVEKVGTDVEGVSPGDRVLIIPALTCGQCHFCKMNRDNACDTFEILGTKRQGTYAEHIAIPDENVIVLPDEFSFEKAAAFPLAYLTAWHMLVGRAKIQPKEKVLIVGASAGVGVASIQICKAVKATSYAVTTNANKADALKKIGADHVFVETGTEDFHRWAVTQTKGMGMDVVVEHVGPATWTKSVSSLAKYGRLVTCGMTTGPTVPLELRNLFGRDLSILGARMGTSKEFQELAALVFDGKIDPVIDKIFPLAEAAQAHAWMEEKKQVGKIILKCS